MSIPATATTWLPTPKAAEALGCSPKHLRAQRDVCGGFLDATVYWAYGPTLNFRSPGTLSWCVKRSTGVVFVLGKQLLEHNRYQIAGK